MYTCSGKLPNMAKPEDICHENIRVLTEILHYQIDLRSCRSASASVPPSAVDRPYRQTEVLQIGYSGLELYLALNEFMRKCRTRSKCLFARSCLKHF